MCGCVGVGVCVWVWVCGCVCCVYVHTVCLVYVVEEVGSEVFITLCRDNVEWGDELEQQAEQSVRENSTEQLSQEVNGETGVILG